MQYYVIPTWLQTYPTTSQTGGVYMASNQHFGNTDEHIMGFGQGANIATPPRTAHNALRTGGYDDRATGLLVGAQGLIRRRSLQPPSHTENDEQHRVAEEEMARLGI